MKKIIFCETPFQVIVSLYIKYQYTTDNDQVDIAISDTFKGYQDIAQRISKKNIFNNVFILKIKDILVPRGFKGNFRKLFYVLNPRKMVEKFFQKQIDMYDEMYCWNYDAFTATFRSYFAFKKHEIRIFIFDEGYISYLPLDETIPLHGFMKLIEFRNRLYGKKRITRDNIDGLILFEPKNIVYAPRFKIMSFDKTIGTKQEFKDLVCYIFNAGEAIKKYDKKYIIFEEALIANNPNIDDEKIFDEIINKVGKENVIIKLHPRTFEDRFSKKEIKTLGNDGVPWEAIACSGDFSKNIMIAISSGSVTTYRMLYGNNMQAYMLFEIVDVPLKKSSKYYTQYFNKLKVKDNEKGIHIPKTMEQFYDMIDKERRNDK